VPGDWHDKVMHGSVTVAGMELMGADVAPDRYEAPKGSRSRLTSPTSLTPNASSGAQHRRPIVMRLEKTFWAERFGMVVDRFGMSWMINCGSARLHNVTGRSRALPAHRNISSWGSGTRVSTLRDQGV
jgi:PhnB protein